MSPLHFVSACAFGLLLVSASCGRPSATNAAPPPASSNAPAASSEAASAPAPAAPRVLLGVEVLLSERLDLVRGKRVGLVTNPSGVDGELVPTVDRLHRAEGVELVRLFGPEHGVRGEVYAGEDVPDGVDPVTRLPVASLHGSRRRPSQETLVDLDLLLFDVQDLGSRTYTFASTLGEVMLACEEAGVGVVVLDRPNPLGGERVEGPVIPVELRSFVGWGPVPVVHGMTLGELALLYAAELDIRCELHVVPMRGWRRSMLWEDTGLHWVQTSPHVPNVEQAYLYVATGMVGGVTENVNEGVGYTLPFQTLAAPFVDPSALAARLEARQLPGVRFVATAYRPFYGRHEAELQRGVRLIVEDAHAHSPLRTALEALVALQALHPGAVELRRDGTFEKIWGDPELEALLLAGHGADLIATRWRDELQTFRATRAPHLLYD